MRTGACFRVSLEAERGDVRAADALDRPIEQRLVGDLDVVREGLAVHGEAVILAGDDDRAGVDVLDRVIRTMVAERHLQRASTAGQRE